MPRKVEHSLGQRRKGNPYVNIVPCIQEGLTEYSAATLTGPLSNQLLPNREERAAYKVRRGETRNLMEVIYIEAHAETRRMTVP